MDILNIIKSKLKVLTFFKLEIIIIVFIISTLGFLGIKFLHKSYYQTIEMSSSNNEKQLKLNSINKDLLKFFIYDEKTFSDVLSNNRNGNNSDLVRYYKKNFLSNCDSNQINKNMIDSLFNEKEILLDNYKKINSIEIKINKSFTKDSLEFTTVTKYIFKKDKSIVYYKKFYKVDKSKIKYDVFNFIINRDNQLNNIILENTKINILIKNEIYNYIDRITIDMNNNRDILTNNINTNLKHFILYSTILIILTCICIFLLIIDLNKLNRNKIRNRSFISTLINRIKDK